MARYTGPRCKECRAAGEKMFLKGSKCVSDKCVLPRRMEREPAGGRRRARGRKLSAYSVQLREKQKVKSIYGIPERQFHGYFVRASKKENTAEALLSMLESRLDNVIFRLGFADSREQARQLVAHGHILLGNRRTDVPSCQVRPGQTIALRDERGRKQVRTILANKEPPTASWLELDRDGVQGKVLRLPGSEDVRDVSSNIQLIVELYSK